MKKSVNFRELKPVSEELLPPLTDTKDAFKVSRLPSLTPRKDAVAKNHAEADRLGGAFCAIRSEAPQTGGEEGGRGFPVRAQIL